jgi:Mg-chelatase subunit ChlD
MVCVDARRFARWALLALSVLLVLPAAEAQMEPPDSGLREEARVRLRTVRLRIQPKMPEDAAACLDVGLDDLKVSLRGEPVAREQLIELDREKEPTLHVLLLDTSRSIEGWLDFIRDSAQAYADQLDLGRDRAMLATFDDSLVLVTPPTTDREKLSAAIQGVRMGAWTSLVDGLYYVMLELEAQPERPVVILLTDGVDSISFHDRENVNLLAEGRPDLIAFTMGIDVPFFSKGMPSGMASSKRFLQRLAARTNGRYFEQPTGYRLNKAFKKIRALLDSEAVLTFADPDPEAEAEEGRVRVSSKHPACTVKTYRSSPPPKPEERHKAIEPPFPQPPLSLPLAPDPKYRVEYIKSRDRDLDPACAELNENGIPLWSVNVEPNLIRACALDITIEEGPLYHFYSPARARFNGWLEQNTRPLEIDIVDFATLPRGPEDLMDSLADHALSVAGLPVRTGDWQIPVARHARPYHDWPGLCNGKFFFHARARLAHGLFAHEQYREWVLSKLDDEARQGLDALKERFRKYAPQLGEEELEEIARLSEQGQEILARAATPAEVDLQHYLAAWLGDISASELFERWEGDRIERLVATDRADTIDPFQERWTELRKIFFVPSYARVLTLLSPVHDPDQDRIGYWRVVLPRPSWFNQRVKGWKTRLDYSDLPMDLVPDSPLGLRTMRDLVRRRPELHAHLSQAGYRVESVGYELLGKAWKRSPERGFRNVRVSLALTAPVGGDGDGEHGALRVTAEYQRGSDEKPPELGLIKLDAKGDDRLTAIADRLGSLVATRD